jgi:hypothetical protein
LNRWALESSSEPFQSHGEVSANPLEIMGASSLSRLWGSWISVDQMRAVDRVAMELGLTLRG